MLKLTRKPGESIQIGDNINFTVLDDKHNQAGIGIDRRGDVEVWRDRIYAKILEHDRRYFKDKNHCTDYDVGYVQPKQGMDCLWL